MKTIVATIVVMEPALPLTMLGADRMLSTRAAMAPVFEAFRAGDEARAVDGFMRGNGRGAGFGSADSGSAVRSPAPIGDPPSVATGRAQT